MGAFESIKKGGRIGIQYAAKRIVKEPKEKKIKENLQIVGGLKEKKEKKGIKLWSGQRKQKKKFQRRNFALETYPRVAAIALTFLSRYFLFFIHLA